jgi:hypothetical protein
MGLGRLQPSIEPLLDEAELLDLGAGVEPMAPLTPLRLHESIALLPVTHRRSRDPQHPLHGADAVDGKIRLRQVSAAYLLISSQPSLIQLCSGQVYLIKYLIKILRSTNHQLTSGLVMKNARVGQGHPEVYDPMSSLELLALRRENDQLRVALATRIVIEQAKGMLAERFDVEADMAFERLRREARNRRMKLRALAAAVIAREPWIEPIFRQHLACEQTVGSSTEGGLTVAETAEKPVVRRSRRHVGGTEGER